MCERKGGYGVCVKDLHMCTPLDKINHLTSAVLRSNSIARETRCTDFTLSARRVEEAAKTAALDGVTVGGICITVAVTPLTWDGGTWWWLNTVVPISLRADNHQLLNHAVLIHPLLISYSLHYKFHPPKNEWLI